ncbi:MAG: class I SAM-dependent methyltransferase [Acidobacteria bacterium]|jgi:ubiquinone/menaquinone biosynthesis C-methylase UbiE|nr:class I SAM-dependent methyltransferase [Acidobacteriota bacterium]
MSIQKAKEEAIQTQSDRADQFAGSYETLQTDAYEDCFKYSRHRLHQLLDKLLPQNGEGLRLLDAGCGTGHHMQQLRARGYEVAGVDASKEMLEHARVNNPDSVVLEADVEEIPLPDASFDIILSVEVLRHLPRSAKCIAEMSRLLKPGGFCLATATPLLNLNGYALINKLAHSVKIGNLARHKQLFHTSARLRREFTAAGFSSVQIHGVYIGPVNWIARIFPKGLSATLKKWESIDRALADKSVLREMSNMFLVKAVK